MRSVENIRALKHTGATVKHLVFRLLMFCQDRLVSFCPLAWQHRRLIPEKKRSEGQSLRRENRKRSSGRQGRPGKEKDAGNKRSEWQSLDLCTCVLVVLYCMYPCTFLEQMSHFEIQYNKQKLYGATTDLLHLVFRRLLMLYSLYLGPVCL